MIRIYASYLDCLKPLGLIEGTLQLGLMGWLQV